MLKSLHSKKMVGVEWWVESAFISVGAVGGSKAKQCKELKFWIIEKVVLECMREGSQQRVSHHAMVLAVRLCVITQQESFNEALLQLSKRKTSAIPFAAL
jgi:hypothetical protein